MLVPRTARKYMTLAVLLTGTAALAQTSPAPGQVSQARFRAAPRLEIFAGYSYFYPHAPITGTLPNAILPVSSCLCSIPEGAGGAVTYDFTRWLGLTGDVSGHWQSQGSTQSDKLSKSSFSTYSMGPKITYRHGHIAPFGEALLGMHHLAPQLFPASNAFGFMVGGGLDLVVGKHFAIRPVQADYVMSNHHFGIDSNTAGTDIRGVRLQAGVTFLFGGHARPAAPVAAAPQPVMAAIAPAVVSAPVNIAPTLQCAAMPAMIEAGATSLISAQGASAKHQSLVYSFKSDAGTISGSGATAILASVGASTGTILVTCHVTDEAGLTAEQTVSVQVVAAPVAAVQKPAALCSVSFARDLRRPTRVDNEAKACLDDIALSLQRSTDGTLVLVGTSTTGQERGKNDAAQRAVNTKAYLVSDKGIDPARILLYTGNGGDESVTAWLVPAGSSADTQGDLRVDETSLSAQPRKSLGAARHTSPTRRP